VSLEELDEEPGVVGLLLDEAPLDGDEGELLLGEVALELGEEPGLDELLLELSPPRSHAARPKASATAAASIESFMCPPWVGIPKECSKLRARPKPLIA
jgi:hypothetical protein